MVIFIKITIKKSTQKKNIRNQRLKFTQTDLVRFSNHTLCGPASFSVISNLNRKSSCRRLVFISKSCRIRSNTIRIEFIAYRAPMQSRRPALNGKKAYGWRCLVASGENRSGLKHSASGPQRSFRRWRVKMLNTTICFGGSWMPSRVTWGPEAWRAPQGTAGQRRRTSLMTCSVYWSCFRVSSVMSTASEWKTEFISSRTLSWISGCIARNRQANAIVSEEVSFPCLG